MVAKTCLSHCRHQSVRSKNSHKQTLGTLNCYDTYYCGLIVQQTVNVWVIASLKTWVLTKLFAVSRLRTK